MDLIEFYAQVEKVDFFYQEIDNHRLWNESRLFYEKMLKFSWSSPNHRRVWLKVKQHKLVDKKK